MMRVFNRLLRLVLQYRKTLFLAVALGWATVTSWVALMTTSAYLISSAALHPSVAELQVAIVGVRFFGISRGVFRYLERYVSHRLTFKLLAGLRVWFYKALEPLAPARLWEFRTGDLLGRIIDDIETLQEFYVRVVAPPLVALLSTGTILAFFGRWGWDLVLTLLGFQVLAGLVLPLFVMAIGRGAGKAAVEARALMNAIAVDSLAGIEEIAANNHPQQFSDQYAASSDVYKLAQKRHNWIEGLHSGLLVLGTNLAVLAVLILAAQKVVSGQLDGRLLAVLVLGAMASFEAILPLPLAFQHLEGSLQAGRRLFEVIDSEPAVRSHPSMEVLGRDRYDLEINNLGFAYSHDSGVVLNKIQLKIPWGYKIAIVGPSGAGKTTLLNLLLRYWDYSDGEILLNGVDIRNLDGEEVRRLIGVISQDTFLFNAPVKDNLLLANPRATEEELDRAAGRAHIKDFISSLPNGYQTWVGEQGSLVSGGERQRIAIARVLLKDAPILLLDEPTANLDPVTEQRVIREILEAAADKSVLLVTHRLVGMEAMDEIVVLDGGRIVERGKHEELIAIRGQYARMWGLERDFILDY